MTSTIVMPYTRIAAWSVRGGISLPTHFEAGELYRSDRCSFILTNTPDTYLEKADIGSSIAAIALNTIFCRDGKDFDEALTKSMNEIRSMRQETIRSNPVLIAEGYGEARVSIDKSATTDRFIVALDGVDKAALKQKHADEFESMRLALSLEGKAPANFVQVADQVYFRHPSGRDVYSFSVSMNGRVYLSKSLSTEGVTDIQSRFLALQVDKSLSAVKRLSSRMTEHERDPLRAFLFGWSALEILIAKCFSRYEQQFMSPLADGPQTVLRGKFLFRVRDVMKDKYRLSDKFHCVSSILFAHSSEDDVRADVEQFQKIKKMRDTMLHGEEYDENGLPIEELASLLQKYTTAYLDAKP